MWQLHVIVSDSILMDWEKTTVKCVSGPLKVLHFAILQDRHKVAIVYLEAKKFSESQG